MDGKLHFDPLGRIYLHSVSSFVSANAEPAYILCKDQPIPKEAQWRIHLPGSALTQSSTTFSRWLCQCCCVILRDVGTPFPLFSYLFFSQFCSLSLSPFLLSSTCFAWISYFAWSPFNTAGWIRVSLFYFFWKGNEVPLNQRKGGVSQSSICWCCLISAIKLTESALGVRDFTNWKTTR